LTRGPLIKTLLQRGDFAALTARSALAVYLYGNSAKPLKRFGMSGPVVLNEAKSYHWSPSLQGILFPTQLRGTASGFAAGVAKLGATMGLFLLPILKEKFGAPTVLGIVSAVIYWGYSQL